MLAATERSFPVGRAPNLHASLAGTFVGIERSVEIDGDVVAVDWDVVRQCLPRESRHF